MPNHLLQELFSQVLEEFLREKKEPFAGSNMGNLMRTKFPEAFRISAPISSEEYEIEGSSGKSKWATVPWVAIMDREITTSAGQGYFIVYLFDSLMNGVYLSLNQGWTQYELKYKNQKIARTEIKKTAQLLQHQLKSTLDDFSFAPINLNGRQRLPRAYELGHICGKFYSKAAIPNDARIISDLMKLVGVYRELKGIVNYSILDLSGLDLKQETVEIINAKYTSDIVVSELQLEEIEQEKPRKRIEREMLFDEGRQRKQAEKNSRVGASAQSLVLQAEQERLNSCGRSDLAQRVEDVSKNMVLGYDILSFEEDETEKYIEVKGSESFDWDFCLSENEKLKAKSLPNYYLYIVRGLGKKNVTIEYIKHPDFESHLFQLKPRSYLVKYKKKLS